MRCVPSTHSQRALLTRTSPQMSDAEQLKYEEPTTIMGKIFNFIF